MTERIKSKKDVKEAKKRKENNEAEIMKPNRNKRKI
jgi:hypothetical protein